MAKIFAILSALILVISAFIAQKNQGLYVEAIEGRKAQEATKKSRQDELEALNRSVKAETATLESVKADLAQRGEAVAAQTQKNTALAAEVASKTAEVAAREAKVADATAKVGNPDELREKVTKLKADRAEVATLNEEIDKNNVSLGNLTAENKRLDGVVADLREQTSWPVRKVSNPKLHTNVSAVFPTWGFVTLGSGENAGVIAGSTLEVKRGDSTVARLLVTAVESSTAAADVIPEANGQQPALSVGDLVVAAVPVKEGVIRPTSTTKPGAAVGGEPNAVPGAAPVDGTVPPAEVPAAPAVTDDPFADFAKPAGN
jgi:hypothetical protein